MKRALLPLSLLLAHEALHRALFSLGLVHQLLGAARPELLALLAGVLFYALRLIVYFVVPGWLLALLLEAAASSLRRRASPHEAPPTER